MDYEQEPFGGGDADEFFDNPEPRCPVILLLDRSYSMSGAKIEALNDGLAHLHEELSSDGLAMKRVELAIVGFGPVRVDAEFASASQFVPPRLAPEGSTPMGEAIVTAIDMLDARKARYREAGVQFYRPWVFMITDGAPTDDVSQAKRRIAEGEERKGLMFYAVGVEGADMTRLADLSVRAPLALKGLQFRELFAWLSNSLAAVSRSQTGDAVPLENPTAPDGWATTA